MPTSTIDRVFPSPTSDQSYQSTTRAMFIEAERARILANQQPTANIGRLAGNQKNKSSDVWNFGGNLGFHEATERFKTDAAQEERERRLNQRARDQQRIEVKRQYLSDREQVRWAMLNEGFHRERDLIHVKQKNWQRGKNSVGYNPITLEYHTNSTGDKLKHEDQKAKDRVLERGKELYRRNNSYNPITGEDVSFLGSETSACTSS